MKALDKVRNNTLGHIAIDYRIACAMYNFTHQNRIEESDENIENAKNLKNKALNNLEENNNLEFLLSKQLGTVKFPLVNINEIRDFPKLSKNYLIENLLFGTCHIRMSKSYIGDLLDKNLKLYLNSNDIYSDKNLTPELEDKLKNGSKIIAGEIIPRYHRGLKPQSKQRRENNGPEEKIYKCFVHYNKNNILGI